MKRKSLFRNVIVSGVTLILISAIIYSCKKSTRIMNPNADSNTFFTAVKATTPLAFEAGAYEVQLAFKDDKGKGAIPSVFELNMPDGKNFGVKITSKTKGFGDVDIYSGTVMDNLAKGPASRMLNFTLIDDQQHESIFADFGINNVDYILSRKEGNVFRLSVLKPTKMDENDDMPASENEKAAASKLAVAGGEQCNGVYIIDLFVGYSTAAVSSIGSANLTAYANNMVTSVNNGLANSLVDNVRLRLVGTGITSNNPGVVTSVLHDGPTWFASGLSSSGADLLCVVQQPTHAPGSALGWGSKPGWVAVAGANMTSVYRHEVGHNAGSGHCDKGITPYAAGYDNGHWKTHMCGNKVNYYSNPDVQDDQGNPIGDPNTANNARLWRERAAIMSGRVAHVKPFTDCQSDRMKSGANAFH